MKTNQSASRWLGLVAVLSALAFALNGCGGSDGGTGPAGAPGATVGVTSPTAATSLSMTITGVTVGSPPVVNFTVTDQSGVPVAGLTDTDLQFNIAKLVPGTNGDPSKWQNYINRTSTDKLSVQGSQERRGTDSGTKKPYPFGTLTDNKNGTYTYTFCTDITNTGTPDTTQCATAAQPNACPAPCTDADGNALDISYQPTLTTRVGIQMSNKTYPKVNATYDFVPAGGAVTTERIIVQTANCNECHNQLAVHGGTRIDTKLCVTCHNPGSWVAAGSNSTTNWAKETVDFKVMIHKIHRGDELPSVVGPDGILNDNPTTSVDESADNGTYKIGTHDFSDVAFPQDIRNCTKCHTNTDTVTARNTPQGDNWETRPSIAACGSCHDNIDFSQAGLPSGTDPNGHPGGAVSDNSECLTCHSANRIAGSIAAKHTNPVKVASAKFKYNIIDICGTAVASKPICPASTKPTIRFSVTDPTGATTHGYGNNYNIVGASKDPEFGSGASLNILIAWDTRDYANDGGAGTRPSRANSINALTLPAVDNGDGTFTVTSPAAVPGSATGSGAVAMEGHPRGQSDLTTTTYDINVPVKGEVAYFGITDTTPVARRTVVDVTAKCDKCHDMLSVHGGNRADNAQLCVLCHNPRDTDVGSRPKTNGFPDKTLALDGQREESIDFKRLIHGIHAGALTTYSGAKAYGMRTKGLVVYGYGGSKNDFSDKRFPGILSDCTTCHVGTTYQLTGLWSAPTQNGILASTLLSEPTATDSASYTSQLVDQTDDLARSPTAAVCTSCHDDIDNDPNLAHLVPLGNAKFLDTQASINSSPELCVTCHGSGGPQDVKLMHGVK